MPETRLREALTLLRDELGEDGSVSDAQRELLQDAASDLERVLEARTETVDDSAGLGERLERAAVDFESEHPHIARTLNEVVAALARMGI